MALGLTRPRSTTALVFVAAVATSILLLSARAGTRASAKPMDADVDSASVAAVIARFHRALSDGDTAVATSLLADDAMIMETGDVETREEYRIHHLPADIEFARAVPSTRAQVRVVLAGNTAWAISTAKTQGIFRGRTIDSQGAELMVVTREPGGWTIRAIHWSSHASRPPR